MPPTADPTTPIDAYRRIIDELVVVTISVAVTAGIGPKKI